MRLLLKPMHINGNPEGLPPPAIPTVTHVGPKSISTTPSPTSTIPIDTTFNKNSTSSSQKSLKVILNDNDGDHLHQTTPDGPKSLSPTSPSPTPINTPPDSPNKSKKYPISTTLTPSLEKIIGGIIK